MIDKDDAVRALSYKLVDTTKEGGFSELAFSYNKLDDGTFEREYTEEEARELGYWTYKEAMPSEEVIEKAYKEFLKSNEKFRESLKEKEEIFYKVKELISTKEAFKALDKLIKGE